MDRINANEDNKYEQSLNNDNEGLKKLSIDPIQVESIAKHLCDIFSSIESEKFYCKVAYYIPRARIDYLVTQALEKGDTPGALFNYLVRKELGEI